MTGLGLIDDAIVAVHRQLAEHDDYRGYSSQISLSNEKSVRFTNAFYGEDMQRLVVMKQGMYKFGRYQDIAFMSINKENIKKIIRSRERL
jgi:hypothetical protein